MDRLQSFGQVRAVDAESRRVEVVVSTGDVARDGMMIDGRGWETANYDLNPVVLWAHDDASFPIARALKTKRLGNDLHQTHEFANHPVAQQVFELVRDGFVNATSVRWLPIETAMEKHAGKDVLVFRKQELLEVSYVSVPADPKALVLRCDGLAVDLSLFAPAPEAPVAEEEDVPDPRWVAIGVAFARQLAAQEATP